MSLFYLLDGYNIIHQMPHLTGKGIEEKRRQFVRLIDLYKPQGSVKNEVTIVFDGYAAPAAGASSASVKIVFSRGISADDKIRAIIEQSGNKKNIIVVTDDREVQASVRILGSKFISVAEFLQRLRPFKVPANVHPSAGSARLDEKDISKALEYKITSELMDVWLKKDPDKT